MDDLVQRSRDLSLKSTKSANNIEQRGSWLPPASTKTELPKKEKAKKPPKPGSKAAILLKQQQQQQKVSSLLSAPPNFVPPTITFDSATSVLMLAFKDTLSLTAALARPHVAYEGGQLKGPLKGVNFPVEELIKWARAIAREDVTEAEAWLLDIVERSGISVFSEKAERQTEPSTSSFRPSPVPHCQNPITYICAYTQSDRSTLLHEWAHAKFHLSSMYKSLCEDLYATLDDTCRKVIEKELQMRNYKESVYIDEWQAYIVEGPNEFGKKWTRLMTEPHRVLRERVGAPPGW